MANTFRGMSSITIAGKSYEVALTLGAMAELASALGVETMGEVRERIVKSRPVDFVPIVRALFKGNGIEISDEEIMRSPASLYFDDVLGVMFPPAKADDAKPDTDKSPPRKRA